MKKIIVSTGIALAAITFVSAEGLPTNGKVIQKMMPRGTATGTPSMPIVAPTVTTGDAAADAQIKALQKEMQDKIKAIEVEYQAKIKAAIGTRKIVTSRPIMGSSTPRMMDGSSTREDGRPPMMGQQPRPSENAQGTQAPQPEKKGLFDFFSNFFAK